MCGATPQVSVGIMARTMEGKRCCDVQAPGLIAAH